ncbi:MAG: hypothetical protein JSS89_13930 [Bacteroidetes bacterium]|nr:hypothetical protein [Bacteroidota bacterium]
MDPNHSDLIQMLLDGELDSMYDARLFGELSTNGDLRNELKQQLAIRNEVSHDRMALIPPASLTGAVFSGLGFTAPMAGAAAGAAGGFVATWLGRIGVPIAAAVLATGAMNYASRDTESATLARDTNVGRSEASRDTDVRRSEASRDTEVGRSEASRDTEVGRSEASRDTRSGTLARDTESATLARDEYAKTRDTDVRRSEASRDTESETITRDTERETMAEAPVSRVMMSNSIDLQRQEEPKTLQSMQLQNTRAAWDEYPAFTLQARGFSLKPMTETSVDAQTQWYQNLGLAMIYKLSDHHSVGVEFGSEVFPQVFDGTRPNGQVVRYEQQPSSMWAAAVYRYSFDGIGETSFRPILQGSFGGTKYGPLGRAMLGMSYSPVGPLSFILGIEGATMAYQYQQNWFTSSKIGLTYGMAVRF